MHAALIAGEASGDLLGGDLIAALRRRFPEMQTVGIAGECMQAAGCRSLYPQERLSVMGLFEILGRLRELIGVRNQIIQQLIDDPPAVFIGIDAPDFNLVVAKALRRVGIPTVQYVSPTVWAWRRYRIRKIIDSVDLMLALFPFEAAYYEHTGLPVTFVGHPLADQIPMNVEKGPARDTLGLTERGEFVAVLPGSRESEVRRCLPRMIAAAKWLKARKPKVQFLLPIAHHSLRPIAQVILDQQTFSDEIMLTDGKSRLVLTACDAAMVTSGTATLETMLLKKPMVVTYVAHPLTYRVLRPWMGANISYLALPNLLAGRALVPEVLQDDVTAESLGQPILRFLNDPALVATLMLEFSELHQQLRCGASERAAERIFELLKERGVGM